jgi:ADP-heptose:LPS heptosyltransferase
VVKRWPLDRVVELGKSLAARRGCRLVVFAGPGEDAYRDELAEALRGAAVRLTTYPIRETAAIVGELDGLVVSDGGIMHVSVAAGTPTVGVFGSAEPDIWFPYEKYGPYRAAIVPIDCRPCHSHECDHISCLRGVTPEMVEDLLFDALSQAAEGENR